MKCFSTFVVTLSIVCFLIVANAAQAKGGKGGFTITTTQELAFPGDGSIAEFDSLNSFYAKRVMNKVRLVVSYRIVHSWSQHNNRDFVEIMEVRDWDDMQTIVLQIQKSLEIAIPRSEDRARFLRSREKYFQKRGFHDDVSGAEASEGAISSKQ